MEWKSLFRPHILERGYDYYLEERVEILELSESEIIAKVDGSEVYTVEIGIENTSITNMECDCPYAMEGNYCKHMAAVLYQHLEDESIEGIEANGIGPFDRLQQMRSTKQAEIENLLIKIPDEEKHRLLVNLISSNGDLQNSLKLRFDFQLDERQMLKLRKEIQDIISQNTVRGFIDWEHAYDFCCSLKRFLDEKVDLLIEKNALIYAFELNNYIFETIGTINMDDSDGGSCMVAEKCYEIWQEVYAKATESEKETIRDWFFSYNEGVVIDWIEDYLFEFKEMELATRKQYLQCIAELDEMIKENSNSIDCGYIYSPRYGRISIIEKRIQYMQKMGMSQNEIDEYCNQNRQFYVVRNMEIDNAIVEGDFQKSIDILLESRQLDKDDKHLDKAYSRKLIEIYQITGRQAEYIEELKYNLLNFHQTDTDYYIELKRNIGEKEGWTSIVDWIVEKNRGYSLAYAVLVAEERFDQAMDMISETQNVFEMDKYVKALSKKVPDRVIQFYSDYVIKGMEQVADRKHYRYLVKKLKTMSFSQEGKEHAKSIANTWKTEYRRRRALLDELKKAGF